MRVKHGLRIPVIILNWNGLEDTRQCLEHVMKQSVADDLEIFLADNGSDDENIQFLREVHAAYPNIQLRLLGQNHGFAKAHNIIFDEILTRSAVPPYVLLINNDAFPDVHWAEELLTAAEQYDWDIVSSRMINYFNRDRLDNVGHLLLNTAEVIPRGSGEISAERYRVPRENFGACAGAALYSTRMLQDIGGFDPYFHTGYEDAELGMRAIVSGYRAGYQPEAQVYHKISQSVSKVKDFNYVKKTQINIFYSWFKLMPWPVILLNLPFMLFKYLTVLMLNAVTGRWFFFRVMKSAIWESLTAERQHILHARRQFYQRRTSTSSFYLLQRMTFFLWFDIGRFYKHFIKGEKTDFEKVNSH